MGFACEHCGAALGRTPRDNPDKTVLAGTVVVKDGRVETTCRSCGRDTVLPLVYVARPPVDQSKVNTPPTLIIRRRVAG